MDCMSDLYAIVNISGGLQREIMPLIASIVGVFLSLFLSALINVLILQQDIH